MRSKIIFILVLGLFFSLAFAKEEKAELSVFYSPSCHECIVAKSKIIPVVEKKFADSIAVKYYNISEIENYKLLVGLKQKFMPELKLNLPVFFMNGKFLNAEGLTQQKLERFILENFRSTPVVVTPQQKINLVEYFKGFVPLAIISAGVIDGINPCAFTVIVFFISFLAIQGYRKRELIIIGLTFIFMVFLTYLLLGLGLFSFLYRIEGFLVLVKLINFSIGIFSIVLGVLSVYDLLKFRKSKDSTEMLLQLPQSVKKRIQQIIGMHYRTGKKSEEKIVERTIGKLVLSALITGFLVSILEAVCTGQTYLPTIVFILKTTSYKLGALTYLLIYNLMFILPLLVIFIFALYGTTSEQFAKILKRNMLLIKILLAVLFFSLGAFLILRS